MHMHIVIIKLAVWS